ncbi:MAG: N-acyl amino acid synthase FeeM domain-containing protein [Usitatibacter sp.]
MFLDTPADFAMHRVASREDWSRVRALRFAALASRGDVGEDARDGITDAHDSAPGTATFLLTRNDRAAGSTRASVSPPHRRSTLPAMEVFPREIGAAIGLESKVVEASFTVVDPAASADARIALFHLYKAQMLLCASEHADWLLAAVRDSEIGFYRRMFNMEILSGAEAYPGIATPRVLMGLQYPQQADLLAKRIPLLAVTLADEAEYASSGTVRFAAQRALRQHAA